MRTATTSTARNATLVAAGILLSRVSGLVRTLVTAAFLGVGPASDAFTAALRIPNVLQNLLGEGVLSASFIPVYSRLLAEGREPEAGRVAGAVAGLLAAVTGVLAVLGVVLAEPLTGLLAAGYTGIRRDLTVDLVRILTPGAGFLVLSAWCLGVLNSHRRFFLSYVAPVVWNAAIVAALAGAALAGTGDVGLATAMAWGTVAGGFLQFAVQLPAVLRLTGGVRPSLRTELPGVRHALRAFGPVVAGRGVVQFSGYVDLFLTSYLAGGAASALFFAQTLYLLPVSVFGMSVAAAELPELSSTRPGDRDVVRRRLAAGLERVAFFVVPTAALYLAVGDLIVGALYERARFESLDTVQVWAFLAAYSVGLPATTASRLLQSSIYALGETRLPAAISALRVLLSLSAGALLMLQLDRVGLTGGGVEVVGSLPALGPVDLELRQADNAYRLGAAGLALAAGVTAWLEYGLLRRAVGRRFGPVSLAGGKLLPIAVAALAAVVVALAVDTALGDLPALLIAPVALGLAGVTYVATAARLRLGEATRLVALVRTRLRR